jgi:hypothetical protein
MSSIMLSSIRHDTAKDNIHIKKVQLFALLNVVNNKIERALTLLTQKNKMKSHLKFKNPEKIEPTAHTLVF